MKRHLLLLITVIVAATLTAVAIAGDHQHTPGTEAKGTAEAAQTLVTAVAAYPLDYCVVSGEKLGSMGEPVVRTYDGREVRFCCSGCVKTFEKDKVKYSKAIDDGIIALQRPSYPLNTCVVSGEELGGKMGDPVDYVHGNRLVRFCCNSCVSAFKKNPDKYLTILDEAVAKSAANPEGEKEHK